MWRKEFMHDTQLLLGCQQNSHRQRVSSFKTSNLSDLEQGTGRLNFVFDEERKKNLRIGLDLIFEYAFQNQFNEIKYRRKSNFLIAEIPNKPANSPQPQKRTNLVNKVTIPKLDIKNIKPRISLQNNINIDSPVSVVEGKTIMNKLQKIESLVKQAQLELQFKNKKANYQNQNNQKLTYTQRDMYESSHGYSHGLQRVQSNIYNLHGKRIPTQTYSNSNFIGPYTQRPQMAESRYVTKKSYPQVEEKPKKEKTRLTEGERMLLNQFKEIKECFKELITCNRQIFNTWKRERTLQTEQSEAPSYFPIGGLNSQPSRAYHQPSHLQKSTHQNTRKHSSHNRTRTLLGNECRHCRCCYENTQRQN